MTINIQSLHFDADKKLLGFIDEKVNKLTQFYENIVSAEVMLRIDKADDNKNKIAEIKLLIKGNEMFAKKQCDTFEEATDLAVAALKTQLQKHKEKSLAK